MLLTYLKVTKSFLIYNRLDFSSQNMLIILGTGLLLIMMISFLLCLVYVQQKKIKSQQKLEGLHRSQQYQLIDAAVRSEENERCRIAEELHDEIGAILSSSKLHFQIIKMDKTDLGSLQVYDKANELLDEAIHLIRGMSHHLHPSMLKEFGLNSAITHFLNMLLLRQVIAVSISLDKNNELPPENHMIVYRILQELIHNILKHAFASKIHVSSIYEKNVFKLTIAHDGTGLTQQQFEDLCLNNAGLGLKNILNRIFILNGSLAFLFVNDEYKIELCIPG